MSDTHYGVVIDTTQSSGNFHREMSAYIIGQTVDSYSGHNFMSLIKGQVKNRKWFNDHLVKKTTRYDEIPKFHWSAIFKRPYVELPTTHMYADFEQYRSIIFYFDEKPPVHVVAEIFERATHFAKNLKDIYIAAGESHVFNDNSYSFSNHYSIIKDRKQTLDVVDIRFFEVSTASVLHKEKKPFKQVDHEFEYIRSEESFMYEHKLRKAISDEEVLFYKNNIKNLTKKDISLVNAYFKGKVDKYKLKINEVMFLLYQVGYFVDDGLLINELNEHYKIFKKTLLPMKGECYLTKNMYAIPYDNVQYVVKQVPKNYEIEENIKKYKYIIKNHHKKIKEVYEHLKSLHIEDIWVYGHINGRVTATFGDSSGVIAYIELGLEESFYRDSKVFNFFKIFVSKEMESKYFSNHTIKDVSLKNELERVY